MTETMTVDEEKHVLLSYSHRNQSIVTKVHHFLKKEKIPVWFDDRDSNDDMLDSMTEAVNNAAVVCCFISPEYENSANCKLELEYAQKRRKPIISCMLASQDNCRSISSKWLDLITGSKIIIDLYTASEVNMEEKLRALVDTIKTHTSVLRSKFMSPCVELIESIRYKYLERNNIKSIFNEAKVFSMEQIYINLVLVENKSKQTKHKKVGVDVKDILETCKDPMKKILVLGQAGIGKSTFCQYASYKWAKGEIWSQYELVLLIPLSSLTDSHYPEHKNYSPIDLVETQYFASDTLSEGARQYFKQQCSQSRVLWILDGYDEFFQKVPHQLGEVFNFICDKQPHILTSCPCGIRFSYDVMLEITGLTDDNLHKFAEQLLYEIQSEEKESKPSIQKFLNFLKSNQRIWGMAHVPVILELICSVWNESTWSEAQTWTIATLYTKLTEWLCNRKPKISAKEINTQYHGSLNSLENLAFSAIEKPIDKRFYFIHQSVQEYFAARHLLKTLSSSSKEQAIDFIKNHKYDRRFLFMFVFASGLLSHTDFKSCSDLFWSIIDEEPIDIVGLRHINLLVECIGDLETSACVHYTRHIKSIAECLQMCAVEKPWVIVEQLCQSLQRTTNLGIQPQIQSKLIELLQNDDEVAQQKALYIISKIPILTPSSTIVSLVVELLKSLNWYTRQKACEALSKIGEKVPSYTVIPPLWAATTDRNSNVRLASIAALNGIYHNSPTDELMRTITICLNDKDPAIRMNAFSALKQMGEKAVTNELIPIIVRALADEELPIRVNASLLLRNLAENSDKNQVMLHLINGIHDRVPSVRMNVCHTLRILGAKAVTNEVFMSLKNALDDEDSSVRKAARDAIRTITIPSVNQEDTHIVLKNMRQRTPMNQINITLPNELKPKQMYEISLATNKNPTTTDLILHFMNDLKHGDPLIRTIACSALGNMIESVSMDEAISCLVSALRDEDASVRSSACFALGKINSTSPKNQITSLLVNAMQDPDPFIRWNACYILGKMTKQTLSSELIKSLLDALKDEDSLIRRQACYAIGSMDANLATDDVISILVSFLDREDSLLAWSACNALTSLGGNIAPSEVTDFLTTAITNEDPSIRNSACYALGKMCEKAATNEAIGSLISTISDKNSSVRRSAQYALERLGEKVATTEVVDYLVNKLENGDSLVRNSVCKFLGSMGNKVANVKMIDALTNALEDKDSSVRKSVCDALESIGEKATTNAVIGGLMSTLRDEDLSVRKSACKALGSMDEKAVANEVIDFLVNALKDKDASVRQIACDAVGCMGEKAITNAVIDGLISALRDEDWSVRRSAWYAIGKMGEKAITNDVMECLMNALNNEGSFVRWSACAVLEVIGEKTSANEAIGCLLNALRHNDSFVRLSACAALQRVDVKDVTNEIIIGLATALTDEEPTVRRKACFVCYHIGEKAATSEVIRCLVNALKDGESEVREAACFSLGSMGNNVATHEIVDLLICAVKDTDASVRNNACYALGNMSKKTMKNAVIDSLIGALKDDDAEVRRSACIALGSMDVKLVTSNVICGILELLSNAEADFDNDSKAIVLEWMLPSFSEMKSVDVELLAKLYSSIRKNDRVLFERFPPEQLLNIYLETRDTSWLPLVMFVALIQGIAITVGDNNIVIHGALHRMELNKLPLTVTQTLFRAFKIPKSEIEPFSTINLNVEETKLNYFWVWLGLSVGVGLFMLWKTKGHSR